MCYYNGIRVSRWELAKLQKLEEDIKRLLGDNDLVVQNGFAFADWPIVKPINGGSEYVVQMAHWEFIAGWTPTMEAQNENRKKGITTLNAIGEELFEKKTYKDAALKRRCLVISSGFYEWRWFKPEGEKKDIAYPYYITLPDKNYFFMAGIWQPWTDRSTGETMDTFAIVTTKANSLMEQVHNKKKRMPTILPDDLAFEWIKDGLSQDRITELATHQYPSALMGAHSIEKDFRGSIEPETPFNYQELPSLVY